jgi:hypothetical protein
MNRSLTITWWIELWRETSFLFVNGFDAEIILHHSQLYFPAEWRSPSVLTFCVQDGFKAAATIKSLCLLYVQHYFKFGKGSDFVLRVHICIYVYIYISNSLQLNLKSRGKECQFNAEGFTFCLGLDIRVTCTFWTCKQAAGSDLPLARLMEVFKKIKIFFNNKGSIFSVSAQEGIQILWLHTLVLFYSTGSFVSKSVMPLLAPYL